MADVASDVGGPSGLQVGQAAGGGFARKSSGLVRDFSQVDSWIYNVIAINVVIYGALTFATLTVTYPHSSLRLWRLDTARRNHRPRPLTHRAPHPDQRVSTSGAPDPSQQLAFAVAA
jgi:hypothetical protein